MTRRLRLAAALRRVAQIDQAAGRLKKLLRLSAHGLDYKATRGGPDAAAGRVVAELLACDPTPRKKYVPWLAKVFNAGRIRISGVWAATGPEAVLPEDAPKIREALSLLERFRTSPALRGLNVMDLDWYGVEDKAAAIKREHLGEGADPGPLDGAEVAFEDGGLKVYRVAGPEGEKALRRLGLGTRWCTRDDYPACQADDYLSRGPVYVAFKGGRAFAQFSMDDRLHAMDVHDRPFDRERLTAEPGLARAIYRLVGADRQGDLETLVELAVRCGVRDPKTEAAALKSGNARLLAEYAVEVLGRRWPEAEPAIAANSAMARYYAMAWPDFLEELASVDPRGVNGPRPRSGATSAGIQRASVKSRGGEPQAAIRPPAAA